MLVARFQELVNMLLRQRKYGPLLYLITINNLGFGTRVQRPGMNKKVWALHRGDLWSANAPTPEISQLE